MILYDEDGNPVGEFLMDSLENVKGKAEDEFDDGSWLLGIIWLIVCYPGWAILCGVFYVVFLALRWTFKIVVWALKFVVRVLWWVIRLPVYFIFRGDLPEF